MCVPSVSTPNKPRLASFHRRPQEVFLHSCAREYTPHCEFSSTQSHPFLLCQTDLLYIFHGTWEPSGPLELGRVLDLLIRLDNGHLKQDQAQYNGKHMRGAVDLKGTEVDGGRGLVAKKLYYLHYFYIKAVPPRVFALSQLLTISFMPTPTEVTVIVASP